MQISFQQYCQRIGETEWSQYAPTLQAFADTFEKKNQVINLASIKSREEFYAKHLFDALLADQLMNIGAGMKIADVGTGGGLPGIPLAILHPKVNFTLIDSVQKKINCVREFAENLNLKNVNTVADRLEAIGQNPDYRETFDLVLSRALAPLPTLLELTIPLVKIGGRFMAMKGPGYADELRTAVNAMRKLEVGTPTIKHYELPEENGERYLLIFEKKKSTSSHYPRRIGLPKNQPL